jgi:ClpP class serine protease
MAQVFVETVARNRGVATETVLTNFGAGGTFVGQAAVDAGLADSIGSFEAVLAELSGGHHHGTKHKGARATMADETFTAEQRDNAVATALAAEKARVADLRKLATAHGATDAELTAAVDGNVTVAAFAVQMADKAEGARAAAPPPPKPPASRRKATAREDEESASRRSRRTKSPPVARAFRRVASRRAEFPPPTSWPMKSSHRPRP